MNVWINYFDNKINFIEGNINVIEIENKKYFYRFVNDLYSIYNEGYSDNISFYNNENFEVNMNGRIKMIVDFFNFNFNSKKYINDISKYVNKNISDEDKNDLISLYKRIMKLYNKFLNNIDLPLNIADEINIENITNTIKVVIKEKQNLLDNLLLLIDLEKVLKTKNILVFTNLKQYLTKNELIELYKYSIYNEVLILLIDSQCYGGTLNYEKKLIIDENLDEFVV